MELDKNGQPAEAVRYFTAALTLRPDNPGMYINRGNALMKAGELDAAILDYKQACALAPQYAEAHHNLGDVLKEKGQLDEAIAEYREALRLKKDFPEAHNNLGYALKSKGQLDEAIAEYREALRLKRDLLQARTNLGDALGDKGQLDEAIAEYREALRLKRDYPEGHYNLGNALEHKGQRDEAIAEFREALRLKKDFPEAHCNLGNALRRQCRFREALMELRLGHELGSKQPGWPYPSAQWVRHCERLVELEGKLPGFLERTITPASPAEQIELARLCSLKRLNRAAARFYEEAFVAEPKLADDLGTGHRYNATCTAALAGCGQGKDADKLEDKDRAGLRRQALDWLRADLDALGRLLANKPLEARPLVVQKMRLWLADTDFAGVREPEALAKLPEAERQLWQKLWGDVADTLARTQATKVPE